MQIRERFAHLRVVFIGPIGNALMAIYTFLAFLTFGRDNFLPPLMKQQWETFALIPHWSLSTWGMLGFAIAFVALFEGSFRRDQSRLGIINQYEAAWPRTYGLICDLEREGDALANVTPGVTINELTFKTGAADFWRRIETELLERLQPHQVTKLRTAYASDAAAWRENWGHTQLAIRGIRDQLHVLAQHYAPTIPPLPASVRKEAGRG